MCPSFKYSQSNEGCRSITTRSRHLCQCDYRRAIVTRVFLSARVMTEIREQWLSHGDLAPPNQHLLMFFIIILVVYFLLYSARRISETALRCCRLLVIRKCAGTRVCWPAGYRNRRFAMGKAVWEADYKIEYVRCPEKNIYFTSRSFRGQRYG